MSIIKRQILIATLKAQEKVNQAVEEHDRMFKPQEIPNGNRQTPISPPPSNVPSEPVSDDSL